MEKIGEGVLKDIQFKRWQKSWSLKQISPELEEYYLDQMDALITKEQLDQYWNQYKNINQ